ncbi:hypothetical protein CHARACLAT_029916 [Characodon lateralis]|uniref:Uncharacterized protein n=1 Tax=Characodon lateralis TaxID=208331 RepID=A0ABU7EDZ1_9TELE|nr:hypothetical protein [Characodon lateralis]
MCSGTWSHDGRKSGGTARVQRDSDKMDIEDVRASQKDAQGQNIRKLPSKDWCFGDPSYVVRGLRDIWTVLGDPESGLM